MIIRTDLQLSSTRGVKIMPMEQFFRTVFLVLDAKVLLFLLRWRGGLLSLPLLQQPLSLSWWLQMEEKHLDFVLVPLGILIMSLYHLWLFSVIIRHPKRTVIGLNALARRRWVKFMMADPLKNGVLAVQTIRNNIMASTLLATTAIALTSLIGVVVSSTRDSSTSAVLLIYGNTTPLAASIKYFAILLCFLVAFLFNVQSIRYYAHTSFLISVSLPKDTNMEDSLNYIVRSLNRGSFFWSLGLRAFYFSFPLFLWIFGPIPMFVCCCVTSFTLYFLDMTTAFTQKFHEILGRENEEGMKVEEDFIAEMV